MLGISCVAAQLAASQEGLSSMSERKYENTDRSNMKGTAVPRNFSAPDDGRVARNM
jgi:hypothetical protein